MSGKQSKNLRRTVKKGFADERELMFMRVLSEMEHNPGMALDVHALALASAPGGVVRRFARRVWHAWRLIDCSPVVGGRTKEGERDEG